MESVGRSINNYLLHSYAWSSDLPEAVTFHDFFQKHLVKVFCFVLLQYLFVFIYSFACARYWLRRVGSRIQRPDRDGPLRWKLRILAIGPPGKSLTFHDSKSNFVSNYFSAHGKERIQLQESFVCFCLLLWWLWFDFCIHLLVLVPTFMVVWLD